MTIINIIKNKFIKQKNSEYNPNFQEKERYEKYFKNIGINSPNAWIQKSSQIYGWLFPGEHELLWELGHSSPSGNILEIGSWMGKSACILAGTCIERLDNSKVICIDPFDMQGTDWQRDFHKLITSGKLTTFDTFIHNAKSLGFYETVIPVAHSSQSVLPYLTLPLRLAFLDGWHDYKHVSLEFNYVSKMVVAGGFIAFHDATEDFPGVKKFVDELKCNSSWEMYKSIGSIVAFRKINY
jgi:cephalosporin hydroxylase